MYYIFVFIDALSTSQDIFMAFMISRFYVNDVECFNINYLNLSIVFFALKDQSRTGNWQLILEENSFI
jgi:hypothetical protein